MAGGVSDRAYGVVDVEGLVKVVFGRAGVTGDGVVDVEDIIAVILAWRAC